MGKQKAKQKRNRILAGILIIIMIGMLVLIGMFACKLAGVFSLLETKEFYARAVVSERNGFDLNNSALIFGEILPGGSASREVFIENSYNKSVRIRIYSVGNISKLLSGFEENFVLGRNETKKVGFSVYAPRNAELGVYDGKIVIEVRRSWFLGNAESKKQWGTAP
ncbi:MAG: hypothetical protein KKE50_04535 [Nanoarchaeota archaeon]|nr:hypothetical protein [Nanoarchaeota archaeon]